MSKGKRQLVKGILGYKRDPRKPILFSYIGEEWPSDDSDDMDYSPSVVKTPGNGSLDDSAIEGDESFEKSDNSQSSPSDCQESHDSGTDVNCKWKPDHATDGRNPKDTWVVSASNKNEGMTLKLNLLKSGVKRECSNAPKKPRKKREKLDSPKKPRGKGTKVKASATNVPAAVDSAPLCPEGLWGRLLPENILVKIFSHVVHTEGVIPFLPRASKVCVLWNRAARCSSLWEKVDLSWGRVKRTEDELIRLCRNHLSCTKDLNLAGWGNTLTIRSIKAIVEHCPQLSSLVLSHCTKISADCIRLLADSCSNLSSVDLCGISQKYASPLTFATFKHLFAKCGQRLTHLHLAENFIGSFPTIIKSIGEFCPNLQIFDASNLRSVSALSLPIESLQHGCPRLRVLRFANSSIALSPTSLAVQAQSPGFPELEELSIAVFTDFRACLGDSDLERIVKTSHKIKLLDVRGCRSITTSGLIRVPAWDIQHLFLSQCDASRMPDLELVLRKWSHSLKEVDLSWAGKDEAINQGVIALSASECQSPLLSLDLHGSAVCYRTIKILLSRCSFLHSLNLQSCRSLPRGMKRLYTGEDLCRLREEVTEGRFQDDPSDD